MRVWACLAGTKQEGVTSATLRIAMPALSHALAAPGPLSQATKNPSRVTDWGFVNKCLTMSYSHMGRPHTTIGAERFHC